MPRIFRNRIGTTKLSLFIMSMAVLTLFCFAAVPSASAQTMIGFYLNVEDSGSDAIPTDGVTVTVTLTSNKTATVVFTANKVGSTQYYLGYKTIINVNGSATATVSGVTAGSQTVTVGSPGSLDGFGFGSNSFETDVSTGTGDAYSSITFMLTKTTGTWTSASNVIAATGGGDSVDAAAQIGTSTTVNTGNNNNPAYDTRDDGGLYPLDAVPTPEPMSYLLFGSGLLLLGVISRKKLGLGRD